MVTKPALGILAAPMLARVAVRLQGQREPGQGKKKRFGKLTFGNLADKKKKSSNFPMVIKNLSFSKEQRNVKYYSPGTELNNNESS